MSSIVSCPIVELGQTHGIPWLVNDTMITMVNQNTIPKNMTWRCNCESGPCRKSYRISIGTVVNYTHKKRVEPWSKSYVCSVIITQYVIVSSYSLLFRQLSRTTDYCYYFITHHRTRRRFRYVLWFTGN